MKDSINLLIEILASRQVVFHHNGLTESKLKSNYGQTNSRNQIPEYDDMAKMKD